MDVLTLWIIISALYLFRRLILQHWKKILPAAVIAIAATMFVNWFGRSEMMFLPPLIRFLMILVIAVWIYRLGRDLFK